MSAFPPGGVAVCAGKMGGCIHIVPLLPAHLYPCPREDYLQFRPVCLLAKLINLQEFFIGQVPDNVIFVE